MNDTPIAPSEAPPKTSGRKAAPTRRDQLTKMLTRTSGATIAQMQDAFGRQPHSARAALSGLRKAGQAIDRSSGIHGAVYRIIADEAVS